MDLDVFCILWGDKYHKAYVYALKQMVDKYLTVPHRFICITSQAVSNVITIPPVVFYTGWWQKIGLFAPNVARRKSLFFDLDVIITGNIDYLYDYTSTFSAPANWAKSGHGGIQSSVIAWPGCWNTPYYMFDYLRDKKKYYGDQEFLTDSLKDNWQSIPHIGSYKYHCKDCLPNDLKVIAFHGKPDPHEVNDKWILPYTQTLHLLIKSDKQRL